MPENLTRSGRVFMELVSPQPESGDSALNSETPRSSLLQYAGGCAASGGAMLEYLFLTCIAPLEAGMRLVLDVGYQWTHSWGWGIIFLSLCVNIVLLPLYHLAETWQEAERRVQGRMAAKLAEIRAVFRGQERYVMIRTLYRQHGYHPVFALRTSVGFLIQVPFFFAAYHFLDHAAFLRGVSFGPLSNLGAPDSLLALGGIHIHLLPFVMTVINLLSALVYTQRLSRRDKVQLYGMAALFFVLLYPSASGLVLYWTCNNIFSLCKNIVYEKFHLLDRGTAAQATQKTPQAGTSATGAVACAVPGQGACSLVIAEASCMPHTEGENSPASVSASSARGRAPGNASTACCGSKLPGGKQESKPARTASSPCDPAEGRRGWQRAVPWVLALLLPCVTLLIMQYSLQCCYNGDIPDRGIHCLTALGAAVLSLSCAIYGFVALRHTSATRAWVGKGVIVLALLLQALVLGRWFLSGLDYFPRSMALLVAVTGCVILAVALSRHWRQALKRYREEPAGLGYAALCWVLAMVCFYTPVTLFASDPPFFDNSFALTGAKCTWLATAIVLVYAACSRWLGLSFRYVSALFLSWITLAGACYTFLVTKDYGIFMGFTLQWRERMCALNDVWVDMLLLTVTAVLVIGIAARRRLYILRGLYWAGTLVTLAVGTITLSTTVTPDDGNSAAFPKEPDLTLPVWHDKLFGFSKDGTNVVVLVLDMLSGSHIPKIWEDYPELQAEFDGFIWYPDTVSPGSCTRLSIPSMLSGHELSPERHMHHDNTAMPLRERIQKFWGDYFSQLAARDFAVSIVNREYLDPKKLEAQLQGASVVALSELPAVYRERWKQEHHFIRKSADQSLFPAVVGLFNLAPWSLRKVVCDKERWFDTGCENINGVLTDVALFEQLARHANTQVQGNTYKFFHFMLTHFPWALDIKTCMPTEEDPYPATWGIYKKVEGLIPEHYYAEVCALKYVTGFLHWLKAAGIYDNTQIILASDHEFMDSLFGAKFFPDSSKGYPRASNALLLVKNRNARGPLQKSAALMSSADIRLLIEADLNSHTDAAHAPWNDPRRVRYHSVASGRLLPDSAVTYQVEHLWRIKGSIFNLDNWEKME